MPERWQRYFAGEPSSGNGDGTAARRRRRSDVWQLPAPAEPATPTPPSAGGADPCRPLRHPEPPSSNGETSEPLRGVQARIVQNMEASLGVPTATSVRTVPAKLLEVNRQILNNHLGRTGRGKVSFTHLIAFAVVQALREFPNLSSSYAERDGAPTLVHHPHVNLGLAVDVERPDGTRTLLVPNIKGADALDFAGFWAAYEDVIGKVRAQKISPDDFAGTTATITNPGMIGTVHSVPRLMPGQSFILGVGAIGYPSEYEGADPHALANIGISTVTTLTNTYDHRIIGGAESGEFLRRIHDLLLGDDFYDDVFRSLAVPYEPARWLRDHAALDPETTHEKIVQVHQLINMYRVRGHLLANLDPLGRRDPSTHPELDINHHGLSIWDLDREFPAGTLGGGGDDERRLPLREILGRLRDAYARTVGVEYMHIQEPDQKEWVQARVERPVDEPSPEEKRRILDRLVAAEAFERFLHTKYLGQKRFSLEGAETLIPMLDALCSAAADSGVSEIVMGMAHRGRLNVLANTVGKSYAQIFREFEGELDPGSTQGSGDVKYHVGTKGKHKSPAGNKVKVMLAANPSHLEAVDPVVEGMARARGDRRGDVSGAAVLPVLIHGDAAFAGQGVVAETLNLSEVEGYDVGGTVHVVVDNQLGFTTSPESGRSSVYATDVAKMVQAPIFHVNGDDPEAAVRVMRLAYDFRREFQKDVVVDLVCYRRYGHNETDEPGFTQPGMYTLIEARPGVRELYTQQLVAQGRPHVGGVRSGGRRLPQPPRPGVRGDALPARHRPRRSRTDPRRPGRVVDQCARHTGRDGDDERRARGGRARARVPPRGLLGPSEAREGPAVESSGVRAGRGRLGARRVVRVRHDDARGHAGPTGRAGHAPRHVQPASQRARRPHHRGRVRAARAHRARPGTLPALRLGPLRVRGPRVRLRLLGRRPALVRGLGGAVRRLHQRRADHRRPVPDIGRRQVGASVVVDAPPPARLRGPGTRALERPPRALPHAVRREQHAGRLPVDGRPVLPRAAASDQGRTPDAARLPHTEALPPDAPIALTRQRADRRLVPERARRPRRRFARRGERASRAALHGEAGPRAHGRARQVGSADRDRPHRAALPVARGRARRRPQAVPERAGAVVGPGGAGQHGRLGLRPRPAPARDPCRGNPSCVTSHARRARAPRAAA